MAIKRRKRQADGTFGEPEKIFSGKTNKEIIAEVEKDTELVQLALVDLHGRVITVFGSVEEESITSQMAIIDLHKRTMEALELRDEKIKELESKIKEMEGEE